MATNSDQLKILIRAESDKHSDKALEFERLGQFQEAVAAYEAALTVDPTHALIWCNKGSCLAEQGRFEEALDCFDRAASLDSMHPAIWANTGSALQNLNRLEEALEGYPSGGCHSAGPPGGMGTSRILPF